MTFDRQPRINWGLEKVAHDVNLTHLATDAIANCKTLEGLDAHTVQIPKLGAKFIFCPPLFPHAQSVALVTILTPTFRRGH
ncbi:hypothetical protein H6F50_02135 [Coleofasciculus sp. FACHB-712]|uniref:hypothetical protein n=1 Tax=Coleofasciculus sp. FACHB-712 TaxID=2692789 RepID=UPI00168388E7|nr:hypothetical protein [Coleofasciculus sp. FACHB-712]MBD1941162.1 hypothetical protein [Coleofasciculus sp. FACHB-712]